MTDYVAPVASKTDPGIGITSEWGKAADNRPLAMFEGATGAPRLQPHALDLYLGDGTWSGTTGAGISGLGTLDGVVIWWGGDNGGTTNPAQIRLSADNGTTWGSWQTFSNNVSGGYLTNGFALVGLKSGMIRNAHCPAAVPSAGFNLYSATLTVPSGGANAFQLRGSGASFNGKFTIFGWGLTT
jgi:hypothetical protein